MTQSLGSANGHISTIEMSFTTSRVDNEVDPARTEVDPHHRRISAREERCNTRADLLHAASRLHDDWAQVSEQVLDNSIEMKEQVPFSDRFRTC